MLNGLKRRLAKWLNTYEGSKWNPSRSFIVGGVQAPRFDASAATRLTLVAKSQYFEKNCGLLNRMADLFECYTVGSGLVLNPSSSNPDWNQRAKAWWADWERNCDMISLQPFQVIQSLMARRWLIDGEVFVAKMEGAQTRGSRPRIQLYESYQCKTPDKQAKGEGETIVDGVALDGRGRPTGYWLEDSEQEGKTTYVLRSANSLIHVFEPSRPAQYRGLPFVTPVINQLHDLDDLQRLEMECAKGQATTYDIIKTETGELSAEDAIRGSTGSTSSIDGKTRYDFYKENIGATVKALQWGDSIERIASNRPSVVTREYWQYLESLVCAGIGIPRCLVYPESMQGTVYRGALDMANAFFRARSLIIADACRRIYEYAMGWAIRFDAAVAGAPQDWNRITIVPPRAVNVDVGYSADAAIRELESALTTYQDFYSERNKDWERQLVQKAIEARRIRDLAEEYKLDPSEISVRQVDRPERISTETTAVEGTESEEDNATAKTEA